MFCTEKNMQSLSNPPFTLVWDRYATFSEKRTCAYQGVRNVSFSENFLYTVKDVPT